MSDLVLTLNNGIKRIQGGGGGSALSSLAVVSPLGAPTAVPNTGALTPINTSLLRYQSGDDFEPSAGGILVKKPGIYFACVNFQWDVADPTERFQIGIDLPPLTALDPSSSAFAQQEGSYSVSFSAPFSFEPFAPINKDPPFLIFALARQTSAAVRAATALLTVFRVG